MHASYVKLSVALEHQSRGERLTSTSRKFAFANLLQGLKIDAWTWQLIARWPHFLAPQMLSLNQ